MAVNLYVSVLWIVTNRLLWNHISKR